MTRLSNQYARAIHASSLRPDSHKGDQGRTCSNTDVLGAYGKASKYLTDGVDGHGHQVRPAPMAVPLDRFFAGDHRAAYQIVETLSCMLFKKARTMRIRLATTQTKDLAAACLAWHAKGRCPACGGHGYTQTPGAPSLSSHECQACEGTSKILLHKQIKPDVLPLAEWLISRLELDSARAEGVASNAMGR